MRKVIEFARSHPMAGSFFFYTAVALIYAILTDGVLRDDAYIFFVYAKNLAATGILSFNTGELSFGVTSIAWTGLLAGGALLGFDVVGVAKVLGAVLGAGGTVFFVAWICEQLKCRFSFGAVAFAALLPNIGADRMVEGMEAGLLCLLSGLGLYLSARQFQYRVWLLGAILGLLFLARPEMAIIGLFSVVFVARAEGLVAAIKMSVGALVVSAWWPIWLYSQIGSFMPPTRVGKLSVFLPVHLGITIGQFEAGSLFDRLRWGLAGVKEFALSGISESSLFALMVTATLSVAWAVVRSRRRTLLALTFPPLMGWVLLAMYAFSFPLFQLRYFTWIVPLLAISLLISIPEITPHRPIRYIQYLLLLVCLLGQTVALPHRIHATIGQQLRRDVGLEVKLRTFPKARIALEPIGEIGYFANRYIVDMGGITDTRIQPYLADGFADSSKMWQCLVDNRADYLVTYDNESGLGCLPRAFPDRFRLVTNVPPQQSTWIRYRLLRVVH